MRRILSCNTTCEKDASSSGSGAPSTCPLNTLPSASAASPYAPINPAMSRRASGKTSGWKSPTAVALTLSPSPSHRTVPARGPIPSRMDRHEHCGRRIAALGVRLRELLAFAKNFLQFNIEGRHCGAPALDVNGTSAFLLLWTTPIATPRRSNNLLRTSHSYDAAMSCDSNTRVM